MAPRRHAGLDHLTGPIDSRPDRTRRPTTRRRRATQLQASDQGRLSLLATWLAAPHVEPWWQEAWGPDDIEARYGPSIDGDDPTEAHIVTLDGHPIGLVIRYRIADTPNWRTPWPRPARPSTASASTT